jgi:hypothetical protein
MQNAKDTFYLTLQARLAAINPARTIVLRGLVRPATLVDENELPTASPPTDAFRLAWTKLQVASESPLPLVALECSITYATDGNAANAGSAGGSGVMARGRLLAAMDAELAAALAQSPHTVPKMNYAATPPAVMATNVFWADPVFGAVTETDARLTRTATVPVFACQEAGEL